MKHLGVTSALFLAACSSFQGAPEPIVDRDTEIAAVRAALGERRPGSSASAGTGAPLELHTQFLRDALIGNVTATQRNNYVLAQMYAIDLAYREFENELSQEARQTSFFTTLVSIGLTGSAALLASPASPILAGIDTGLKGASEAFSRDILVERTISSLTNQMRGDRDRVRAEILKGLTKTLDDYPPFLALGQVENYYAAGTLYGAVAGVNAATAKEASAQRTEAEDAARVFTVERIELNRSEFGLRLQTWLAADLGANTPKARACYEAVEGDFPPDASRTGIPDLIEQSGAHSQFTIAVIQCLNREHAAGISLGK